MKLPNKVESIKSNYHRDDAVILLEKYFDEWSKDEDWWYGGNTWDLNIFTYDDEKYVISVYGLVKYDDDTPYDTNTGNELDKFEFKL